MWFVRYGCGVLRVCFAGFGVLLCLRCLSVCLWLFVIATCGFVCDLVLVLGCGRCCVIVIAFEFVFT